MSELDRPRTASPFGLSHLELPRLTEGLSYLRRQGVGVLVSAMPLPNEGLVRDLAREAKNRMALHQRRAKTRRRPLWLRVNEAVPSYHWHIVAPFPTLAYARKAVEAFNNAEAFLRYGPATIDARLVTDWGGLSGYLLKEATSQAWWAAGMTFRRKKGSHALGEGGGDRVILSPALEDALVRAEKVEPRRRQYAARSLSRPTKSKRARGLIAGETQLSLFPHLDKPIARLGDWTEGVAPEAVVIEMEFLRKRKRLTQNALAKRAGMSRQRYTNIVQRRFGATAWGVQRIREALAA